MWTGLLPAGETESGLSEEEEEEQREPAGGVADSCVTRFQDLQKRRLELQAVSSEKRRRRRKGKRQRCPPEELKSDESPAVQKLAPLDTLQKYFGVNDRLEPPVCNKVMKKSRLEQNLDEALKKGDVEEADLLSDRLATREIAVKITKAAAYHRHMKAREEPQTSGDSASKRKAPAWGFEAKKRWETKSNMGYM